MDIFQQAYRKENKKENRTTSKTFNDLDVVRQSNKIKDSKINSKSSKSESELDYNFDYSKLNIKLLQISCQKLYDLNKKPFNPFIDYIKNISDKIVFLHNNYFNDLFYNNDGLYLPIENSFIIAFIENNFFEELNKLNILYYNTGTTKIPRKSISYILKKDYLKEPLDIRNCFICPYYNFKNQDCTL